jgi:hypothetical protein
MFHVNAKPVKAGLRHDFRYRWMSNRDPATKHWYTSSEFCLQYVLAIIDALLLSSTHYFLISAFFAGPRT